MTTLHPRQGLDDRVSVETAVIVVSVVIFMGNATSKHRVEISDHNVH